MGRIKDERIKDGNSPIHWCNVGPLIRIYSLKSLTDGCNRNVKVIHLSYLTFLFTSVIIALYSKCSFGRSFSTILSHTVPHP